MTRAVVEDISMVRRPKVMCIPIFALVGMIVGVGSVLVFDAAALSERIDIRDNVVSTRNYLRARYLLLHEEQAHIRESKAAGTRLILSVSQQCPGVATDTGRSRDVNRLIFEVGGAVTVAMAAPDRLATRSFVGKIKNLAWRDRRIAGEVKRYLAKLRAEVSLATVPNLCKDVRDWVGSPSHELSPDTQRFIKALEAADAEPEEIPQDLLKVYEVPSEQGIVKKIDNIERKLENTTVREFLSDWSRLLKVMGFSQGA